ncbi:DUF382-domain-containing protein [Suhomyces tanzawaensis NRRL Y-17324]|uniref:DUF382-domain-containing protein n=1 Tax=Suhomyces tanzawaensis NRRL Y-17324 TaxID=984487 RepID=A0A1E4SJC6_9ASCO|nr:DUF382-domain-containing protein [Suhomyces tanzawaensis NRRL Y-17324]ODV79604.1 DUF382-domain-containing protein [Suhomyces tanzawaensis NRRL Y-17324]
MGNQKRTKNQIRREKAKLRKLDPNGNGPANPPPQPTPTIPLLNRNNEKSSISAEDTNDSETTVPLGSSELMEQFSQVFDRFKNSTEEPDEPSKQKDEVFSEQESYSASDSDSDYEDETKPLSKRQLRLQNKVSLAYLKASTNRPQLVDWHDVDARDPFMLVAMKSQPNAIQVPDHWTAKREYLSGRKGMDRMPFELPKFIRDTGIQDMRQPQELNLRQEQRNKVQPKMGRLDIDYQKLYNAFFKHQEQPRMFGFGDVYFEGKEANDDFVQLTAHIKPGVVSSGLRKALEMTDNMKVMPPWISIMQDIGKPPSYKNLVIPGLDTEYSNTGYREKGNKQYNDEEYWGKMQEYVESSEEEDEEDEEDEEEHEEEEEVNESDSQDNLQIGTFENEEPTKVPISELGNSVTLPAKSQDIDDNKSKSLYTIIDEQTTESGGVLSNQVGYDLSTKDKKTESDKETTKTKQATKKFKF